VDEFALIQRIRRLFEPTGSPGPGIVLGNGDDAAVLDTDGEGLVATTDSLVEGTHFRWDLCRPRDVGFKAAAVSLSDLAAMGARPLALLVSFTLPADLDDKQVIGVSRGLARACRGFGVSVVGGNVAGTQGPFEVNIAALGRTLDGRYLTRSGARPGDLVLVSGHLGSAALGLAVLMDEDVPSNRYRTLVRAFLRPEPRLELGLSVLETPGVHCAMDVSDGFLADLGHLVRASGVGARVEVDRLPLCKEALRFQAAGGPDPVTAALNGGEDYELLVCDDPEALGRLQALGLSPVGTVNGRKGRIDLYRHGRKYPVPKNTGYKHR